MKKIIVSIRDCKAGFLDCRTCASDDEAVRDFRSLFSPGQDNMLSMYPGDFALMKVAEFDTENGSITSCISPELLCSGFQCVDYWQARLESDERCKNKEGDLE